MKKQISLAFFLLFILFITSCEDNKDAVYHGNINDGVLLSFGAVGYSLPVVIDATGVIEIPFYRNVLSPQDRTYDIEFIEGDADPLTYNLPSSVTISANQYFGTLVITGQDGGLLDTNRKSFSFRVKGLNSNEFIDKEREIITVDVFRVCPFGEEIKFEGIYIATTLTPGPLGDSFSGPIDIKKTGEFDRGFTANYLPQQGGGFSRTISLSFVCGDILIGDLDSKLSCDGGTTIAITSADVFGYYNPNDDSEFTVIFKETYGDCNSPDKEITVKFTKQ